jgi:pimeloyl-ACP methyl ester carboxylesterase
VRSNVLIALLALAVAAAAGCGDGDTVSPDVGDGNSRPYIHPRTEWGEPSGPYAGEPPRALVLLIHGGGWRGPNLRAFTAQLEPARQLQRLGFATAVVEYRRAAAGIRDVVNTYRVGRERFGPSVPICASGSSAGGHLALMLAVREPGLACAINRAGATDLVSLAHQPGGKRAYRVAKRMFGRDRLAALSPVRYADSIRSRLLSIYAANDRIAPVQQGRELVRAKPDAHLIVLPPGPARFVHSGVDPEAKARATAATLRLLESVGRPAG